MLSSYNYNSLIKIREMGTEQCHYSRFHKRETIANLLPTDAFFFCYEMIKKLLIVLMGEAGVPKVAGAKPFFPL